MSVIYPLIPYFITSRYRVAAMVNLADPKRGEVGADLGSGDGRIVIAFAEKGVSMCGYEVDTSLKKKSEQQIYERDLTSLARIYDKSFWEEDLGQYDIITIYPMPDIMDVLEAKLQQELKPGARVLLNYYPFTNWQYTRTKDHIYLYTK